MNYAKIIKNDITNGDGICVSFWVQGCEIRCPGCHNASIWDFDGGKPYTDATTQEIITAISANGLMRNFSVLGGEPLTGRNIPMTRDVITKVRNTYPDVKIYLWTGYELNKIINEDTVPILKQIDFLIDGPYLKSQRDITLHLRGSKNQKIRNKEEIEFNINLWYNKNKKDEEI